MTAVPPEFPRIKTRALAFCNGKSRPGLLAVQPGCSKGIFGDLSPLPYTGRQLSLRTEIPYLSFSSHISATVYPFIVPLSRKTPAEIQKMFKTERLCRDCKPRAHVVCLGDTNNMGGNDTHGR